MVLVKDLPQLCNYYTSLKSLVENEDECAMIFMYSILRRVPKNRTEETFREIKGIYQNLEELMQQLEVNSVLSVLKKYEKEVAQDLVKDKNNSIRNNLLDYLKREDGNIEENVREMGLDLGKILEIKSPIKRNYLKQDENLLKDISFRRKRRRR